MSIDLKEGLNILFVKLSGLIIVLLLFLGIRALLARKAKFLDFFIGDLNAYSLSRVQIVAWVYFIISYQVTVLFAIMYMHGVKMTYDFDLVFSEQVLWLLGMSSASYLSAKSITSIKIGNSQLSKKNSRNWGDLIKTDGKLDFSRFQYLIWTIFALYVFILHCNHYLNEVIDADEKRLKILMSVDSPDIPSVSWSFIVLMGLSQGAYIGKKLIPAEKATEFRQRNEIETRNQIAVIDIKMNSLKQKIALSNPISEHGVAQVENLKTQLADLQKQRDIYQFDINRTNEAANE